MPRLKLQGGHCHRQFETAGAGTAGIDVENSIPFLDCRPVRVPGDHDAAPGSYRIEIEFGEVMQHVDRERAQLDDFSNWKTCRPFTPVVIATNRAHWGDFGQ